MDQADITITTIIIMTNIVTVELFPFGKKGKNSRRSLFVEISLLKSHQLKVVYHYKCNDDRHVDDLDLLMRSVSKNLWEETCFELFLKKENSKSYLEFNFSPVAPFHYQCFAFDDYRHGMREIFDFQCESRILECKGNENQLKMEWMVNAPSDFDFKNYLMNTTAVLVFKNDEKTYWAPEHLADKPDFHLADNFKMNFLGTDLETVGKGKVVFVGNRKGAIQAAKEMGLEVLKWSEDRQVAFTETQSVSAVIALTEKAVVTAARLREKWNLTSASDNDRGNSLETAIICHDKYEMKKRASKNPAIPLTPYHLVTNEDCAEKLVEKLGLPIVLKERRLSGSRGLKICRDIMAVKRNLREGMLAEKFIEGREISIEAFVQNNKVVFRSLTHYYLPLSINIVPAVLSEEIYRQVIELNDQVIATFNIERGITHMEVYLTDQGPVFGEIALRPPGGRIMELLQLSYPQMNPWKWMIQNEMGTLHTVTATDTNTDTDTDTDHKIQMRKFSASWIIHPGAGIVRSVEGVSEIEKMPEVVKVHLKLKEGKDILPRQGSGEDQGHILFVSDTYEGIVKAIEKARMLLKIRMND